MNYSEKLNGYWEEGYHFYIEIRDLEMTVREYRRKITLKTAISYDAESLEKGLKTPIKLEDNVLSYGGSNNPMSWFEEVYYEDGLIKLVEGYSFMDRKDPMTFKKVEQGPFDHIVIRDEEFRERLQGKWLQWSPSGNYSDRKWSELVIENDKFRWRLCEGRFHVISYNKGGYDRDKVYLVPWDLTESDFMGCTRFEVLPDMLTTHEMIFDMSTPLSVFAREEDIDKIDVPAGAKTGYGNPMNPNVGGMLNFGPVGMLSDPAGPMVADMTQNGLLEKAQKQLEEACKNSKVSSGGLDVADVTPGDDSDKPEFLPVEKEGDDPRRLKKPYSCKCGEVFEGTLPKFCCNCGARL